jgi:hypothetical protein
MLDKLTGFTGTLAGGLAFALILGLTVFFTPKDHPLRWLGFVLALGAGIYLSYRGSNNQQPK